MNNHYDHSREGLAEGCCSAISPCSHQQRSPYTICAVCTEAALIQKTKTEQAMQETQASDVSE